MFTITQFKWPFVWVTSVVPIQESFILPNSFYFSIAYSTHNYNFLFKIFIFLLVFSHLLYLTSKCCNSPELIPGPVKLMSLFPGYLIQSHVFNYHLHINVSQMYNFQPKSPSTPVLLMCMYIYFIPFHVCLMFSLNLFFTHISSSHLRAPTLTHSLKLITLNKNTVLKIPLHFQ